MEISFEDRTIINGKLQVRVRFADMVGDHYYSADLSVWIPEQDSWAETKTLAMDEAKMFLRFLVGELPATAPLRQPMRNF